MTAGQSVRNRVSAVRSHVMHFSGMPQKERGGDFQRERCSIRPGGTRRHSCTVFDQEVWRLPYVGVHRGVTRSNIFALSKAYEQQPRRRSWDMRSFRSLRSDSCRSIVGKWNAVCVYMRYPCPLARRLLTWKEIRNQANYLERLSGMRLEDQNDPNKPDDA